MIKNAEPHVEEADPDCEFCRAGRAIRRYSEARVDALTRRAIHQIRRITASGIYGDARPFRTLWEEYCHEVQNGPHGHLSGVWDRTLHPLLEDIVASVPSHEAVLLTMAAEWDDETTHVIGGRTDTSVDLHLMRRAVEKCLAEHAGARDLSHFDQARR